MKKNYTWYKCRSHRTHGTWQFWRDAHNGHQSIHQSDHAHLCRHGIRPMWKEIRNMYSFIRLWSSSWAGGYVPSFLLGLYSLKWTQPYGIGRYVLVKKKSAREGGWEKSFIRYAHVNFDPFYIILVFRIQTSWGWAGPHLVSPLKLLARSKAMWWIMSKVGIECLRIVYKSSNCSIFKF